MCPVSLMLQQEARKKGIEEEPGQKHSMKQGKRQSIRKDDSAIPTLIFILYLMLEESDSFGILCQCQMIVQDTVCVLSDQGTAFMMRALCCGM